MELTGKVAIVTGASRGIGRAIVKELVKKRCGLLLTALEGDELSSLAKEIAPLAPNLATRPADLSKPEERKEFIEWVLRQEPAPDILVNNAGMGGNFGRFETVGWESLERAIALNVTALVHLTHELIPILKKRPRATIVNISSGSARLPYPGLAVYGATKGFVSSFSETLWAELATTSIRVLCFHPGFTLTPFITTSKMSLQTIPSRFVHTPERVASRIVKAIEKDKRWAYSDLVTHLTALFANLLPPALKVSVFRKLFWRLPDEA